MKTSLLATLSFLLFSTNLILARSASYEPVFDVNGDEVKSNLTYYVVSVIRGAGGGGLDLTPGRNGFCPFDILQHRSDLLRGSQINFTSYDNSTIIRGSTDLNVISSITCREIDPAIWKVSNYDASRGKWFIEASRRFEKGNPVAQTLLNWFKIENAGLGTLNAYKFFHCPSVCESCVRLCNNIGISYDDGRRLVLLPDNESAFRFVLIPATENQLRVN